METDYDPYEPKQKHGIVYNIFKWAAIVLVVGVYLLLFFRMCIKEDPALVKTFLWTENSITAYEDWQKADPKTRGDFAYTQDNSYIVNNEETMETITYSYDTFSCRENAYSGDGTGPENSKKYIHYGQFHISNPVYIPSAGEAQVTFRVNDEGLEELMTTYGLKELPKGEIFAFALFDGETYYTDYSFIADERFTYLYRRLTFSGVDYENLQELRLLIYYVGEGTVDLTSPYEYLTIYLADIPMRAYDLKDAKPVEVNGKLEEPPYLVFQSSGTKEE